MIFYFDEHVPLRIALRVRAFGHRVVTTDEMGQKRAGDEVQLFLARHHGWVLVTHNINDFLLLHRGLLLWATVAQLTDVHAGIVLLLDSLAIEEKARLLDIFVTQGLPTASMCYEWRDIGGWRHV